MAARRTLTVVSMCLGPVLGAGVGFLALGAGMGGIAHGAMVHAAKSAQTGAPEAEGPRAAATPTFELLDPGREPLRALRYEVRPGSKERATIEIESSSRVSLGETDMPVEQLGMKLEVEQVIEDAGKEGLELLRVSGEITGADTLVEEEEPSMQSLMVRRLLRNLRGVEVRSVRDARGIILSDEVIVPAGADAATSQIAQGVRHTLLQTGAHFPEEPIGEGAKWRVTIPTTSQGMEMVQTIEYELVSIEDDTIELRMILGTEADAQMVRGVQLESLKGEGTGEATIDLQLAVARRMKLGLSSTSRFVSGMGGRGPERTQTMRIDSVLRGERAE